MGEGDRAAGMDSERIVVWVALVAWVAREAEVSPGLVGFTAGWRHRSIFSGL
jgi:hypothetical protein